VAIEADSGRKLWEKSGDDTRAYQGASLAARGPHAVYCAAGSLMCLDRKTGAERWRVALDKSAGEKGAKGRKGGGGGGRQPGTTVALMLSDEAVYLADGRALTAFALKDGARMWSGSTHMNHYKAPDLFLTAGAVWTANNLAYDPRTGQEIKTLSQKMNGPMGHDRCYRNRITERYYINTATGGSDFLALDGSGEFPNPWARSTCGIGFLPCNGLLYLGPPACSCCNMVQLNAFNALAPEPGLKSSGQPIPVEVKERLEKGAAYGEPLDTRPSLLGVDWPTYRQDAGRNGCTKAVVSAALQPQWQTRLTTRPSAPVVADGKVFVADVDAHALCALDAASGRVLWRCTTGARVDSPPTYHHGRVLFGSRDGWVYCLRAADGALAWRFKALPDRLICVYEQLESPWPVCGSILVKDNVAYFAAGRNSFLDGGIFLFGLDPQTGRVVHQQRLFGPYGEDGYPLIANQETGGFGLQGHKGDILLADDQLLYLRHQAFKPDLTPVPFAQLTEPHLITCPGFIEAIPHHRSFWTIDAMLRYDIPTGGGPVHGDILVKDGARYYEVRGYRPSRTASFDPRKGGYTLYAGEFTAAEGAAPPGAKGVKAQRGGRAVERWSTNIPLTGKAIAMADEVLFVAGTPVAFPEDDLAKAYEGRMGGVLWAASAADGRKLAAYELDAPPVWDSLAAVNGRLFLCTTDGKVRCFAGKAGAGGSR
jgi:outer membrane protein assembly factor BamB